MQKKWYYDWFCMSIYKEKKIIYMPNNKEIKK